MYPRPTLRGVVQVATTGLFNMQQGGIYVEAGGLGVDQNGITTNSGLLVNAGGAYIAGVSSVRCLPWCTRASPPSSHPRRMRV